MTNHLLHGIKAVFFDAGGTLLYPYPSVGEVYARVASNHGVQACQEKLNQVFREVWNQKDGLAMAALTDEKSEKNWWREIVRETFRPFNSFNNFELFFEDLYDQFASPATWRLFDETHSVLAACKEKELKVGMISNWDRRLIQLCESFQITEYFDFMLISALFGKAKPHRDIFDEAVRLSGFRPEECLHLGDSLEDDVQGAMSAGVKAVWIDRHARGRDKTEAHAIRVISNLSEIF
ncbi:MAG TPA: HAD-IA family hydrolase [Candidatus Omnitrophota bacterium]|nr:HAD-IA family hydrolase [Candidatus Omnitrophota bacterium]